MCTENNHSLTSDPAKCIGCVDCTRLAPRGQIRVRDGHAVVKYELCTDCGFCIHVCRHDAMKARTSSLADLKKVPVHGRDAVAYALRAVRPMR